jgi:transposase
MSTVATRPTENTSLSPVLYLAFELSSSSWKLAFTTGLGQRPRECTITARALDMLCAEVVRAKRRFGLSESVRVVSCYEAGRDGFWLHRYLVQEGITNYVVDASSIEVNRRARRAKSDRLDVQKLLVMLMRYHAGEQRVWHVVHVPTVEEEDRRHLHRELLALKRDRTRVTNRIKGLLATHGVKMVVKRDFSMRLESIRLWDGSPLPSAMRARLQREWVKVELLTDQIQVLEAERSAEVRSSTDPVVETVRQLLKLRGIGENSAWLYTMEFFAWRRFRNRRELGALAGLTPTPYQSGASHREQGIAKAGNRHVRTLAIEIAWAWVRYQPDSALTRWYQARFAQGGSRQRRIGIVALARRLLVELWRYLETGALPEGAVLKA